jgi:pyruvate,water dikinase
LTFSPASGDNCRLFAPRRPGAWNSSKEGDALLTYTLPGGLPAGSRTVWSRLTLLPLAPGLLTPFSYSVLADMAGRAWFLHYDRLGFDPTPRARVLRHHQGFPYANATLSAQREAEAAGVAPPTLLLDGKPFPFTKWEKSGFLAGIKAGMNERKIDKVLRAYADEVQSAADRAQEWLARVRAMRWSQAEILQIMEEIEPLAAAPFATLLAVRQSVDLYFNRIALLLAAKMPAPEAVTLLDGALAGVSHPVEDEIARRLRDMAAQATPAARAWLAEADAADWQRTCPDPALVEALRSFLDRFGHRSAAIAEVSTPRWEEDPAPILRALAHSAAQPAPTSPGSPAAPDPLASLAPGDRKQTAQALDDLRRLLPLQSRALDAVACIFAGTRRWALAASYEAMGDRRILHEEDVFFFALEEMKQMMTGEWNVSDAHEIQATAEKRRAAHAALPATGPDLLIGDAPAKSLDIQGLPVSLFRGALPRLLAAQPA